VDTTNFKCFRLPEDGSMYYGEIAYIKGTSVVSLLKIKFVRKKRMI
jgi:hypothetical protein